MASLIGHLNKAGLGRLQSLATAWGLEPRGTDNLSLIREIMAKMMDRWYLRGGLEELGDPERQILFHLVDSFKNWLTAGELTAYCRIKGYDAKPAIDKLASQGLVIVDDWQEIQKSVSPLRRLTRYPQPARGETAVALPTELVPEVTAVREAVDQGDVTHIPMGAFLSATNVRDLQMVAEHWGIPRPYSLSKPKLITVLLKALTDSPSAWTSCPWYRPRTAKVLEWVREKGGKATVAELRKEFGEELLHEAWGDLGTAMLLDEAYIDGRRHLFIPREIRQALGGQKGVVRESPAPVQPLGEPVDTHMAFVEDLNTLMNFISNNRVELTTAGYIPQRTLAKITALFRAKEEDGSGGARTSFIVEVASKLRLLKGAGDRLEPGDGVDAWASLATAEQLKQSLNNWLGASRFEVPAGLEYYSPRISWPNARSRVLKHLAAGCKVGQFYNLQTFAEFTVATDQELLGSSLITSEIRRYSLLSRMDVDKTMTGFVTNVIAFPLHWLGLTALARASTGGPGNASPVLCFSLTPVGAWALDVPGGAPPPEASNKPLIVQPNFEIVSILAGGQVLRELSRFADLSRSDQARLYTLTKASVLRGIDDGLSAEGIVDFLNNHSQKEIPQNVAYSIADWVRQYAPLTFSTATVVEVEAEHVLSELLAAPRFSSFFARRLSPTAAIVNPDVDLRKLANELRKRGYSPHLTGDQTSKSK
ncbi:MAG: helicase-associated domain-containing protein [Chloroflexi bacterium]|nr:helicase-associated domain-containing protein [Chloroflexota bacterium]